MDFMISCISGLRGVGAGDGSDFTVAIIEGDKNVLLCSFKPTSEQCQVSYDWKVDLTFVILILGSIPRVSG